MSTSTTRIAWTDRTWGPTRGCSRVSPGCESCYAERQAYRFSTKPGSPYEGLVHLGKKGPVWTGKVRLVASALTEPLSWRKPARVFVDSMSDLFHEELSNEDVDRVFAVMLLTPRHTFQVLTKRARRMREYFERDDLYTRILYEADQIRHAHPKLMPVGISDPRVRPASWIWLGVSAEDQQRADERIPDLLRTPAAVRFVSYEPALGPIDLKRFLDIPEVTADHRDDPLAAYLLAEAMRDGLADAARALAWIIVGGESGPRARPFNIVWAQSVVDQCKAAGVACFVKQLGRKPFDGHGRDLPTTLALKNKKGGDMAEWPVSLRVRQFPEVST